MASQNIVSACVLIIGNEILSGRTQDLNLQYIAQTLGEQGVSVQEARVIPDVAEVIVDAVNYARKTYDYVLTTGGIGPTHDDITAECIATAFGVELVMHPAIEQRIRGREAPADVMASRLLMARVPEGASLIDNLTGGPQGFTIENVYVMAGIPAVLQAMLPTIKFQGGATVKSRSVRAHMGESEIATQLRELQDKSPGVDIGSYPFHREGIYGTTLVVRGTALAEVEATVDAIRNIIRARGSDPVEVAE
ncbi:MAG: competence/damage-inducible protein A [Gammaproteobacteria bacterium]|nr:competence/damage-inducible protein A [Gammaproteobacteria bacterium]